MDSVRARNVLTAVAQPTGKLVFIPRIGFRPVGTRTLTEPGETFAHETRLTLLAVAAAADRVDAVVEWERDPATCVPDSLIVAPLRHSEQKPLDRMTVTLDDGQSELNATTSARPAYTFGPDWGAAQTITFPPLSANVSRSELRVSEDGQNWRVPFTLQAADPSGRALAVEVKRDGAIIRATALVRREAELVVGLEAEATLQIRQIGWPIPTTSHVWSHEIEDDRRRAESTREFFSERLGDRYAPITLEDERRGRREEIRRLFSAEQQQSAPGEPFINRFSVVFDAPSLEASAAVLAVPFVALNDSEHSVTVDLRNAPVDVAMGEQLFRVLRTEAHPAGEQKLTKVIMEIPSSTASPRFVQPRRMQGARAQDFAWQSERVNAGSDDTIWMATAVGDPPVVTFEGVVFRVDGPFRLELPLD